MTSTWCFSARDWMMLRFAGDNHSTLSYKMRKAGPMAWKSWSATLEGVFPGSLTGILADSVCRWHHWFPSRRGTHRRATRTLIPSPSLTYTHVHFNDFNDHCPGVWDIHCHWNCCKNGSFMSSVLICTPYKKFKTSKRFGAELFSTEKLPDWMDFTVSRYCFWW